MKKLHFVTLLLLVACAPAREPAVQGSPAIAASPAEQVVQVQLEAYNRRDIDAFAATYSPQIRIYNHPDQLLASGLEQLRESYSQLFARAPDLHATVTNRIVQGNFVIDHERVTGIPDVGQIEAVAMYEVRDGRIANVWFIR